MNKKQVFIIIVVLAMLGSTIAFSFFFASPPPTAPSSQNPEPSIPATSINYSAAGIPATVYEVFPRMIVTASTNEAELSLINTQMFQVNGIESFVRTEYGQDSSNASGLIYIAEFFYSKELFPNEVFSSVQESTSSIL